MADDNSPPQWPTGAGISDSEAVDRMASLREETTNAEVPVERPASDAGDDDRPPAPQRNSESGEPDRSAGDGQSADGEQTEGEGEGEAEAEVGEGEEAPDFWSADDKEWWGKVPPELRPILKKYEAQRIEFANQKAQEAANERKRAMEEVQKLGGANEQYANWWKQNEQQFTQTFVDRWAGVDFNKLASENPAEWARLSQMRASEHAMLTQAATQAQEAQRVTQTRAKEAFEQSKVAEHAKVAAKYPAAFGPLTAEKTYKELGEYLYSKGIPPERINTIHEAPIIEMAWRAMRQEQAEKKASTVTSSGTANNANTAAPKKVTPGPAQPRGNRNSEGIRQAQDRLKRSGGYDTEAAMALLRLTGN